MSQELQLGKYEFFPYDEKIQRLLDELLLTEEEREKRHLKARKEVGEYIKRDRKLKKKKWNNLMTEKNYYEILQINDSAQSETIHAAYKRLAKESQYNETDLFEYISEMQQLNKA